MLVSGNYIYVLTSSNLKKINKESLEVHSTWENDLISYTLQLSMHGKYLYLTGDEILVQLNATNVSQNVSMFRSPADIDSPPAISNGYAYINSCGYIYQLNASKVSHNISRFVPSGAPVTSFPPRGPSAAMEPRVVF